MTTTADEVAAYYRVLEQALTLAKQERPDAAPQLHAAFANSVAYMVCDKSGGYGGPSAREHAVCQRYTGRRMTYEDATTLLLDPNGLIFGPITDEHRRAAAHNDCFDDARADLQALSQM